MYKLFLTLRYLLRRRIAAVAVIGVWLCVALVLIVISVMGGFLEMVKERSRGLLSDLIMDNQTLQGFPYYEEFIDEMKLKLPDVVDIATPAIYNYGIIRVKDINFTKPVQVIGIRLDDYIRVNDFGRALFYNKYYPGTTTLGAQRMPMAGFNEKGEPVLPPEYREALAAYEAENPGALRQDKNRTTPRSESPDGIGIFHRSFGLPGYDGDELPGIILGTDLINSRTDRGTYKREFWRGWEIILTLLPMTQEGVISATGATTVAMRYIDDSYTRVFDIDKLCVYVDFELLQRYLHMDAQELVDGGETPPRASQILIKLKDGVDAYKAKEQIEALWARFYARLAPSLSLMDDRMMARASVETWQERQIEYISAVEKEKVLMLILFALISLVTVALIGCIFYMIVVQKTRDIGIIKSVGASASGVASIFIGYGAAIGIVGSILGSITGAVFVYYINDIQDRLAQFNPNLRVWDPKVYAFDRIPNVVNADEVVVIFLIAVAASMLGALIPAILAARVWPVKALRYE